MDSQYHNNTQHSPGGKSHVCSKCGWNYPNPHPSAKNRRAHKKICGTIKGFEILGYEQKEHCLDDEQKKTSPRVVVDERIGEISEEDVFADAVCEFSSSLVVSDSIKEKEEETAAAKCNNPGGETQHCNKIPEVVQESLDVLLPVQVLEKFPSSVEAQVIHSGGLETKCKGNESESALGKRVDTCASSWNDEVIYSDLEGPHGGFTFDVEEMNMNPPGEADYTTVSDKNPVDIETIADQVINTSLSALDATIPFAENAHVSLHGTKGLEDSLPTLEDKTEPHGQTSLVAVKESPSVDNIVMLKIDAEDVKMKPEEGASQETVESETVRTSLPAVYPIVADSNADVSHSDLIAPESELTQANVVAEENSTISEISSQSSSAVEHYVSPESVVLEGDEPSVQKKSSTETSKDSILQIGAEACRSTDEEDCSTPNDSAKKTNQKLVEGGSTESNGVVGGLGVIQANEIDGNVKTHNIYAETTESNDHRDFGRLQNLSEAHIRSLVLSPLVTRDNTSTAISGHSEPENESQSSSLYVGLLKNQEITTSWSTGKEQQHVPLKNLLNEARSPRVEATNIPRVSSILTSPEDDGGWPERREVSEEWNSPAKYPVERKVKGRPFWVPFVCCSSAAK